MLGLLRGTVKHTAWARLTAMGRTLPIDEGGEYDRLYIITAGSVMMRYGKPSNCSLRLRVRVVRDARPGSVAFGTSKTGDKMTFPFFSLGGGSDWCTLCDNWVSKKERNMSKHREMNDSELDKVAGGNVIQNVDGSAIGGVQVGDGDPTIDANESLGDCGMIRGTESGNQLGGE